MASKDNPFRCPECDSTALNQQQDKRFMACASCGKWFKLIKWIWA